MGPHKGFRTRKKLDILAKTSDIPGLAGQFETFIRRFRTIAFLLVLIPIFLLSMACMGLASAPGIFIWNWLYEVSMSWTPVLRFVSLGIGLSFAYLVYGISLIFIVPLVNFLLPLRLKEWRGIWFSLQTIPWYAHNALTYVVRYTFLEFVTPTPLNVLFYKMMGMKIGKGVVINTTHISDPCMITIEDYVTIGGSAHIFAHYGQKGILIVSPVVIKKGATIGLKSSIMGDVVIGEKAIVKPHTAVMPKTRVPDGATI
ncbi:MAG: hypothetical protein KDD61_03005 [Bdellovibrionales bacterium]|nr:hypothetical protein [Bdellovibrionales bacterium]